MRYALLVVTLIGLTASSLALREHYREYGDAPCDINDHWDCGIVNHSPYAVIPQGSAHGVPVAVIGIGGFVLLGVLALKYMYRVMLGLAVPALAFSLYLARIEHHMLGVWCLYCVISLGAISLLTLMLIAEMFAVKLRRSEPEA
jgi:vitamin-K-epoxide reductase (warfarin-sensitive)